MKYPHVHSAVEMSRINYQQPDLPLSPKKSDIILAKKRVLVGEVVNGGALPTPPQHIPVCSFDSQNKYRGEVLVAEPTTSQIKGISAMFICTLTLQTKVKINLAPLHSICILEIYTILPPNDNLYCIFKLINSYEG